MTNTNGNIYKEYIIAATHYDAVEIFDRKYEIDGHLPNIQTIVQIY